MTTIVDRDVSSELPVLKARTLQEKLTVVNGCVTTKGGVVYEYSGNADCY